MGIGKISRVEVNHLVLERISSVGDIYSLFLIFKDVVFIQRRTAEKDLIMELKPRGRGTDTSTLLYSHVLDIHTLWLPRFLVR